MIGAFIVSTLYQIYNQMELEGFGASLVGRALYVYAGEDDAWVPWEFISSTTYSCRILITGSDKHLRTIETEYAWTVVVRPTGVKDWACIATIVRGMGQSVLLVFDIGAPVAPATFVAFMDACVAEGRIVLTRVWIGQNIEIPAIPDAIFFPLLRNGQDAVYDMIRRLPGRLGHGSWTPITPADWATITKATADSGLGIVVTDIGETSWQLFWHKLSDSRAEPSHVLVSRGFQAMRTGMALVEKNRGPN